MKEYKEVKKNIYESHSKMIKESSRENWNDTSIEVIKNLELEIFNIERHKFCTISGGPGINLRSIKYSYVELLMILLMMKSTRMPNVN